MIDTSVIDVDWGVETLNDLSPRLWKMQHEFYQRYLPTRRVHAYVTGPAASNSTIQSDRMLYR